MPLISAEEIDHGASFANVPTAGATTTYGRYLVSIALYAMCYGADFTGGPPIEEGAPAGPNIAVYGAGWSEEQCIATVLTGATPNGRALNVEYMPREVYPPRTELELAAIPSYLATFTVGDAPIAA